MKNKKVGKIKAQFIPALKRGISLRGFDEKDYYINLISPFTKVAICNMTLFYLENKTENSDSYFKKLVELQDNLKNGISVSDDILTNKNLDVNNFNKEYLFYKKCLYNNK